MYRFSSLSLGDRQSWDNNVEQPTQTEASNQVWSDEALCEPCSMSDVYGILLCRSERQNYSLGSLIAIKRRQQKCWLCRSVYTLCVKTMPRDLFEALLEEDSTPLLLSQDRYGLGRRLVSEFVDVPGAKLLPAVHDVRSLGSAAWDVLIRYHFELGLNDAPRSTRRPVTRTLTYEEHSLYTDYGQICEWLQICSTKHRVCQQSDQRQQVSHTFYLIDVHSRHIQAMESSTIYVALSYTWGDPKVQRLATYSSEPLKSSQRCYFPRELPAAAPLTVEDAITAVKHLGQRYLWTDLYCIDQTDTAERQAQIQQMGAIYEGALLTVCAISSANSTAGIHGISKPCQAIHQLTTRLKSSILQITGDLYFNKDIQDSVWLTRAWTFQESKLAGRKLCFGAHGVFLWCGEEVFHHSNVDPNPDHRVAMRPDNPRNPERYRAFEPLGDLNIRDTNLSDAAGDISLYFRLVNEFCQRQVTFESDAQDAIKGLLRRMAVVHDAHFVFGLPTNHLTRTLTWSCGPCLVHPRRSMFPSWSWLGWNADPARTRLYGEQPEYEFWLENWPALERSLGRRAYKLRVFWVDPGYSTDQGMDTAVLVVEEACTSLGDTPHEKTLLIKAQTVNCQVWCLARHSEPVPGFTAAGESLNGQLARGDIWAILDGNGENLPRDMVLDTDNEATEDYTFEISPEISSRFDPSDSGAGDLKLVLLQRWLEVDEKTGERKEYSSMERWGDRGWFLIVAPVGEGEFERIALLHMEYEHFEDMDTAEETIVLV